MRWLGPGLFAFIAGCASTEATLRPAEGQGGVMIECVVDGAGRLMDCKVLSEEPAGPGFGEAALCAARQVRLDPDVLGAARRKIRYSIRFRPGEPAALDQTRPRA